jgi:P27 family predicted phage terminase small subunit
MKAPRAPANLSATSRNLWGRLRDEYGIRDVAGLAVLEQALRSLDRAEQARRLLDRQGVVVTDRWGQSKPHPAAAVERDSRAAFLAAVRQLGVQIPEGGE